MIQLYIPYQTSRIEYIFEYIFKDRLGLDYQCIYDKNNIEIELPCINYSHQIISTHLQIVPHGILQEDDIRTQDLKSQNKGEKFILFTNHDKALGFDVFSACFYMLSRYEEYVIKERDRHNRFPFHRSLAYQFDCVNIPIVDKWITLLKNLLHQKWPQLTCKENKYQFELTFDIDNAFAFKGKGMLHNIAGLGKNLLNTDFKRFFARLSTLFGGQDPYDSYKMQQKPLKENVIASYFFLIANQSMYDTAMNFESSSIKKMVDDLQFLGHEVSWHPSYAASLNEEEFQKEKTKFETHIGYHISKVRMHYLKLQLPQTYQWLVRAGISKDYTMCFAENTGFRAGTSFDFPFFDLNENETLALTVCPTVLMDTSYYSYMNLTPKEAIEDMKSIKDQVSKYNGKMTVLFHNESIAGQLHLKGWEKLYCQTIEYCQA